MPRFARVRVLVPPLAHSQPNEPGPYKLKLNWIFQIGYVSGMVKSGNQLLYAVGRRDEHGRLTHIDPLSCEYFGLVLQKWQSKWGKPQIYTKSIILVFR